MSENNNAKEIKGYAGKYLITDDGEVISVNYKNTGINRVLAKSKNKQGYYFVCLYKNNQQKQHLIHRLVAQYFVENSNNYYNVFHINGIKDDNSYTNLKWDDKYTNNLYNLNNVNHSVIGETKSKRIYCKELNKEFDSIRIASRELNIPSSSISYCCNGLRLSAGTHPATNEKLTWIFY